MHSPSIFGNKKRDHPFQVPVVTLDEFPPFEALPSIQLIKIDVEGYEPNVFDGMTKLLKAGRVKNIFCEFNP